jgi:hypothetical protein
MDIEQIRQQRMEIAQRKADRYLKWADSAMKKYEQIGGSLAQYNDWQFISQPILIGHHSENRHRRLRERISRQMEKQSELYKKAEAYRQKAANILNYGTRVRGDAERAREVKREAADQMIVVGTKVKDFVFGIGTVIRVNKKTYSIHFDSGGTYARDKSWIQPIIGERPDLSKTKIN